MISNKMKKNLLDLLDDIRKVSIPSIVQSINQDDIELTINRLNHTTHKIDVLSMKLRHEVIGYTDPKGE